MCRIIRGVYYNTEVEKKDEDEISTLDERTSRTMTGKRWKDKGRIMVVNNSCDYCQYLIDSEHRASRDKEMSNVHHLFLAPRPAAQPLCRHSKHCFASLGEDSSRVSDRSFRIKWWTVPLAVASRWFGLFGVPGRVTQNSGPPAREAESLSFLCLHAIFERSLIQSTVLCS